MSLYTRRQVVDAFLRIAEAQRSGKIAVHCFAGLGRTGACIVFMAPTPPPSLSTRIDI